MTTAPVPESELLPCPFCGGEPERLELTDEENFGGSVISCKRCGASSPVHFDRKENLLDSWNRRSAAIAPTVKALEAGIEAYVRERRRISEEVGSWFTSEDHERALKLAIDAATALSPTAEPAPIDDLSDAHADMVTQWFMDRFGRPDNRGMWKARAEKAEAGLARQPAPMDEPVSPSDPRMIIAGIRQFGLAPDGSDLRDLEAALSRPQPADGWREALVEALRVLQQTPDSRRSNAHKNAIGKLRTALATPSREPDSPCSECGAKFEDARGHAPTCSRYPHDWSSASTGEGGGNNG